MSLINQMERGLIGDPHFSTLVRLAAALEIGVGELVDEDLASPKVGAPSPQPEGERREAEIMSALVVDLREDLIEDLTELGLGMLVAMQMELPQGTLRDAVERALARVSARTGVRGGWRETEHSSRRREQREQREQTSLFGEQTSETA